ncbi:MAG TPA: BBP7 family outer membrane beta-barrel protein, partial [Gemmataceae bacterium]|nr:BBP7 family outer membrane beta-barrel protein [Gemmataceae bacterium]
MRNGLLALVCLLAVGAGLATAQPIPDAQPATVPVSTPAPRYGRPWDRSWEGIVLSASGPSAATAPPAQPQPPEEPQSPANQFWLGADYLLWWTKNGPLPTPLVTTGPAGADILGGLTQQGTHVLFGGAPQDYGTSNGLRMDMGFWLDTERHWGLEAGFFMLEQNSTGFAAHSTATGNPVLAQPLIDPATGQEFTEVVALPGLIAGGVAISSHSRFQGWEINGLANAFRTDSLSLDLLAGFRTTKLDEDVQVTTDFAPLTGNFLSFRGATVSPPGNLLTYDAFQA